jgi:broad specificity phosphatase PhoE
MDLHKETVDGITWNAEADAKHSLEVTFARHGETDWNKKGKMQGQSDIPLNDAGRAQAKALAKELRGRKFDAVISSDLKRASETAEIVARELGLPKPEHWEILRERNQGEWDGRLWEDVRSQFNLSPTVSLNSHPGNPPGGESLQQFLDRGAQAARKMRATFPEKRVLVVSHAGTIGALRVAEERLPVSEAFQRVKNANALHLTLKPRFIRIPDVLDCWFESGSMPYAQSHFPFDREHMLHKNGKELPPGFPADFIAEGIDQTRGWFYTLTVLSTALFNRPAFRHCIVNGTVLAEDGKKMSKRLKNYPEPLVVVEKHGADAVRFALMSSPAVRGEDLRFSEKTVEESLRNVLLPLWNAYAFFVTYANTSGWKPRDVREHSSHPLDRWIRAEVQDLVNRMTTELDRYDLSATCAELHDTIDALTNWYVRLSRRRFAGKAGIHAEESATAAFEEDQEAALTTLYDVLLTISQLLAPFCPFITDAIYLNLVPEKHGSVHLTDWPEPRALSKEEERLLAKTRVLRSVVSLGLTVRAEKKIKLRQPLAGAVIAIPPTLLKEPLGDEEISLLQEELNVKEIDVIADPGSLAQAVAMVDARKVGPRLGSRVQELIAAGKRGEFTQAKDGSILIGEERLAPDEARIVYVGKEGQDVAADRGIVVSINTTLSQELSIEGCGRDLIRAIQKERKDAGLAIGDRIKLTLENADDIVASCGGQIVKETNAVLEEDAKGDPHEVRMDGRTILFRFEKL